MLKGDGIISVSGLKIAAVDEKKKHCMNVAFDAGRYPCERNLSPSDVTYRCSSNETAAEMLEEPACDCKGTCSENQISPF